jgi:hypothetical protein
MTFANEEGEDDFGGTVHQVSYFGSGRGRDIGSLGRRMHASRGDFFAGIRSWVVGI